jgi:peroxiredoxin
MQGDQPKLILGDPVPRFTARTLAGAPFDLSVAVGRWIVLCFLGSPAAPQAAQEIAALAAVSDLLDEDRLVVYAILTEPPADAGTFCAPAGEKIRFFADYEGAISGAYGAIGSPRTGCSIPCCAPSPTSHGTIRPGTHGRCAT